MVLGFVSGISGGARGAEEVPISAEARAHFEAGVNLLQDPDGARHEEAYREFKAAYAASPSWKILGNLAITAQKLERDGEALAAYRRYLAEAGGQLDADERAQVERDIATLNAGVVELRLDAQGGSVVDERFTASGTVVHNAYTAEELAQPIGVRAGRHRFTAKRAGARDAVWEVNLAPKQSASHRFELEQGAGTTAPASEQAAPASQPAPSTDGLRIAAYAAFGVGVVGVGLGTVFGLKSKSEYDAGNELCPAFPCRLTAADNAKRLEHGEEGDAAKTLSIVGFAAGGVGLAAGVTLFVLSGRSKAESARVEPYVGWGAAGVRGVF
jgi:hypothetical protein